MFLNFFSKKHKFHNVILHFFEKIQAVSRFFYIFFPEDTNFFMIFNNFFEKTQYFHLFFVLFKLFFEKRQIYTFFYGMSFFNVLF